jgi:hypothetical protein
VQRNLRLPFVPPEDWHEPHEQGGDYRIIVQDPGKGFMHVVTPAEVRARLAQLPAEFIEGLEVVQLSRMTRKKLSFPCYGMQWGSALYLYPIETELTELYYQPPQTCQQIEAEMYGGRWIHQAPNTWKLEWTLESIKNFYLNNILIHELGHLLDDRNNGHVARERYAEWFAIQYGYRPTRQPSSPRKVVRRHAKRS